MNKYLTMKITNFRFQQIFVIYVKVHMKRFLTVVFHFIIVKISIKERYIG